MKIYWVLGYEGYYPSGDNFDASFETYEEAKAYVESENAKAKHSSYDIYDIVDISDRL